eukprot:gene523-634_t
MDKITETINGMSGTFQNLIADTYFLDVYLYVLNRYETVMTQPDILSVIIAFVILAKDVMLVSSVAGLTYYVSRRLYMSPKNVRRPSELYEPLPYMPRSVSDAITFIDSRCFGVRDLMQVFKNQPRILDFSRERFGLLGVESMGIQGALSDPTVMTIHPK